MFRHVRHSLTMKKKMESLRVHKSERRRISSDAKVAKVFSIVASAFLLCWLPIIYITTADIINRYDLIPHALSIVSFFTIATSSLVNPLMYAFLKPDFKLAIRTCFRRSARTNTGSTIRSLPLASFTRRWNRRQIWKRDQQFQLAKTEGNSSKENTGSMENSSQCFNKLQMNHSIKVTVKIYLTQEHFIFCTFFKVSVKFSWLVVPLATIIAREGVITVKRLESVYL